MIYLFSKRPDPGGFSDEELQIAARAVQDAMLRSLEEESESKHIFSESFLARMNALFRKDERRNGIKRALQHAAIIVIGVFLAGALLLAFNPEVRADFTRWVKSTFEKSISINISRKKKYIFQANQSDLFLTLSSVGFLAKIKCKKFMMTGTMLLFF